jgi:hypothetical protein
MAEFRNLANFTEVRNAENFSVSDNVKRLKLEPRGDGIYPIIVNSTDIPLSGLLLFDGDRVWVKVPGNGSAKLPTYDYKELKLVDEQVTV